MKKGKIFGLFLLVSLSLQFNIEAQSDLAIGSWKSYLPHKSGRYVTQGPEKVYYSTEFSVFSIDKSNFSTQFLSKVEGLNDIGISVIKYDSKRSQLIIAYSNSNVDVIQEDGTIINLSSIATNTNIIGDKNIYDIHIATNDRAYLACGFGILELDLEALEFGFTSFSEGLRFVNISSKDSKLFGACEEGVYIGDLNSGLNLGDFNNWSFMDASYGMPLLYESSHVEVYKDDLYILSENILYRESDLLQMEQIFQLEDGSDGVFISAEGEKLILGTQKDTQGKLLYFDEGNEFIEGAANCSNILLYAIEDDSGRIWFADNWNDIRYTNGYEEGCQRINFDSPYSHKIGEIFIKDNEVFVSSGGVTDGYNFLNNQDGFYILSDQDWKNYNGNSFSFIGENNIRNAFRILPHPTNSNQIYIGSFYSGLMKMNRITEESSLYHSGNSIVTGPSGGPDIEKIGGMAFDANNDLWISSYESTKPLIAMSAAGNFHSFDINTSNKLGQVTVDQNDNKWIVIKGSAGGILVYDEGDKIEDPSDDRQRFINSSNSQLPNNNINCIEVDRDGDVWVGTTEGPVIFECGDPFDPNCQGSRRRVLQDSIPAILLQYEEVRTIAADGANRKWIGTRNGIFVQTPSGEFQVARIDISNSPLFDNNIIDLAYNPESGEMFIGSDKGLQSVKTETLGSKIINADSITVFPNPVRPDYDGPIAIKGLATDANVKITDVQGRMVYETKALGGQAIWYGKDYNNRKVSSGVYLVFISSTPAFDDPDTAVAKILLLH